MTTYSSEEALEASIKYFNGDELAANVFLSKYALRNEQDELLESTPDQMHDRLAKEFYRIEKNRWPNDAGEIDCVEDLKDFNRPLSKRFIRELFDHFKYIVPQGSPMYGIGNNYTIQSLGNCFTLGEHPYDSYGGILYADQMLVQLSKRRCGVGICLDKIRPKGLNVRNAARSTDGIGIFMERFSNSTREVAQSGRRGALLLGLSVHHPEIETFITAKQDLTKVTGANISVLITDEFMKAVQNNKDYEQRWPIDTESPEISKIQSAKKIWDLLVKCAHATADPGLQFIDTARKLGTSHQYGKKDHNFYDFVSNPCFHPSCYLLTENGYKTFGDLYNSQEKNNVITDNRISFDDTWVVNTKNTGTTIRNASTIKLTGKNKDILSIQTKQGFELKVTENHHIATPSGMIEAKDLKIGQKILISAPDNECSISSDPSSTEEIDAYLMGLIAGDGTFSTKGNYVFLDFWGSDRFEKEKLCTKLIDYLYDNEFSGNHKKYQSKIKPYSITQYPDQLKIRIGSASLGRYLKEKYNFTKKTKFTVPQTIVENCRTSVGLYYLAGLFYSDGSVQGKKANGFSVRLSQSNYEFLKEIQLLLHANGMVFSLYKRRDERLVTIKNKSYWTKANYELISRGNHHKLFFEKLRFFDPIKDSKLSDILENFPQTIAKKTFELPISKIENCGKSDVFCLEEPITKSVIVNGISARRCGEIIMGKDSCRLMLLNLFSYVLNPFTDKAKFDYKLFKQHSIIAQRLMDAMVDLEIEKIETIINKIKSDPEPDEIKKNELDMWLDFQDTAKKGRRTGLGITALGDCLAAQNIEYGNIESINTTRKIYKTLCMGSLKGSCQLAQYLKPFPLYSSQLEENHQWLNKILSENKEIAELHSKYGRRNVSLTTTAPAGTVSIMTQTTSGIEPAFLLEYTRRRKIQKDAVEYDYVDDLGDKWEHYKVYHHKYKMWQDLNPRKKISPYDNSTANNIDWEKSVDIQAAAQEYVTHSISKTINVPESTSVELIDKLYRRAYEKNLKGVTVYRDGCRSGVLVADKQLSKIDRPKELQCDIHHTTKDKTKYAVLVGLENGFPYEIFGFTNRKAISDKYKKGKIIKVRKSKYKLEFDDDSLYPITSFMTEEEEMLSRTYSLMLRNGIAIEEICKQLHKTEGNLGSFSKAMEKVLSNYADGKETGEICPECSGKIIYTGGCKMCGGPDGKDAGAGCGHSVC